jgi:ferrous iron transport protein A
MVGRCYAPRPVPDPAITLDGLAIGRRAEVVGVSGPGAIAMRLLEMGFVPGTGVEVVKAAPLGDPLELRIRGYHLSLRRAEAAHVRVREQVRR